ncbi:MAG: glycosyltransferase family 4 protein [Cyanobacteria bacterium P01_D01_bin.14]
MKILMVHNRYQIQGGEDRSFDSESQLLEQYGHQVFRYIRENNEIAQTISRLEVGVRSVWSQTDYLEINRVIEEFSPDIVHVQNFFPLISPSVYYAARKHNIPVIQSLRNYRLWCLNAYFFRASSPCELCLDKPVALPGIFHRCYRDSYLQSTAVALMQSTHRLLRTWQKKVDRYIVLTDFFKDKAVQGGLPDKKLSIKPNFVATDPGAAYTKENFLLYVGRLSPEKGIQTLLAAWMQHSDLPTLKFIGRGPMVEDIQKVAGQREHVDYLGELPLNDVYDWMGKAKALVFSSQWYEGLPRTIIEAFAKGTPVITSRLGAMENLVGHQYTGLHFELGNVEDLVRQIRWMEAHPQEWAVIQQNARKEFELKFTAERNYQLLMAIYQRAISEASR